MSFVRGSVPSVLSPNVRHSGGQSVDSAHPRNSPWGGPVYFILIPFIYSFIGKATDYKCTLHTVRFTLPRTPGRGRRAGRAAQHDIVAERDAPTDSHHPRTSPPHSRGARPSHEHWRWSTFANFATTGDDSVALRPGYPRTLPPPYEVCALGVLSQSPSQPPTAHRDAPL